MKDYTNLKRKTTIFTDKSDFDPDPLGRISELKGKTDKVYIYRQIA